MQYIITNTSNIIQYVVGACLWGYVLFNKNDNKTEKSKQNLIDDHIEVETSTKNINMYLRCIILS